MSRRRGLPRRDRVWWLLVALAALSCARPAKPPGPAPPAVDTAGMETPVAGKIEAAREAVRGQPASAEVWGRLGMVFQAHALETPAVESYRRAMELAPEDYRWPYLAALAEKKRDPAAAAALFERALSSSPDNPAFYIQLGDLQVERGDPTAAAGSYRTALERAPASSHALYGLGRALFLEGRPEEALGPLRTAVGIAPNHREAHLLLAQIQRRLGDDEEAELSELRARAFPHVSRAEDPVLDAMEAEEAGSRAHNRRGLWLARAGRFAEAEAEFRRVLEIRPGNFRDFANLGGALARQGKHREAVEAYEKALQVKPGEPSTLNNLALALADVGEMERAVETLEEVLGSDPSYAEAHYNLGLVRFRQRRLAEAVTHYREALRLQPALVVAHDDLGKALALQGRLSQAVESWRRALALDPRRVPVLYNLSTVLVRQGRHREAVTRLREGLGLAPDSSGFVSLLAWELATAPEADLRDGAQARHLAERLYSAYPQQPSSLDVLAAALAETGDFESAERAASRGVELARSQGKTELAAEIQGRLARYQSRRPYRQGLPPG